MSEPTEPAEIHHGLAVYQRGQGHPLLALPYPHASGGGPMIDGPLVSLAAGCGFQVSTFDPPGQYRSTRPARVSLDEMVDCATETLGTLRLPARVAVIGHSMSALCALYLALAHPDRVAKLVLVGTPPGSGMAIVRYRAMPFHWPPWNPNLWRMVGWGILLASGHGSLETHKKMDLLSDRANFVNQALVSPIVIEPGDRHRPAPPADRCWRARPQRSSETLLRHPGRALQAEGHFCGQPKVSDQLSDDRGSGEHTSTDLAMVLRLARRSHEVVHDRGWAFIAADAGSAGPSALVDA